MGYQVEVLCLSINLVPIVLFQDELLLRFEYVCISRIFIITLCVAMETMHSIQPKCFNAIFFSLRWSRNISKSIYNEAVDFAFILMPFLFENMPYCKFLFMMMH